jgi:hypothetical protein
MAPALAAFAVWNVVDVADEPECDDRQVEPGLRIAPTE